MLHIVLITPGFASDEQDSISLPFLQLFIKNLLKESVSLSIICEQYPSHDNYIWNGLPVYTLRKKTPKIFYKFLRKHRLTKTLLKIHATKPIHIIHNFWFNILGQMSYEFALKNKIRHLITLTGQDILSDNVYLPLIKNYAGTLVSPSEYHKNKLLETYPVQVHIIPWGIEEVNVSNTNRSIDLIQCGGINSVKNNFLFLEIVAALKKTGVVKKGVICGGGPLFKDLLADIQRLGLSEMIEIKNAIPRAEVLELMKQSKVLVHTSHFESFGLVLAEGLASHCKVISTPVGIAYDNKDIVCCSSKDEFISEIQIALAFPENSGAENRNQYPIEKTVSDYMQLYTKN